MNQQIKPQLTWAALALLTATLALGGCKSAEVRYQESGHTPLKGAELRTLVVGNTLFSAPTESTQWAVFYEADGSMRGVSDGDRDAGRWVVEGDRFCSTWTKWRQGAQRCFTVYREADDAYVWFAGNLRHDSRVASGNSQKL